MDLLKDGKSIRQSIELYNYLVINNKFSMCLRSAGLDSFKTLRTSS